MQITVLGITTGLSFILICASLGVTTNADNIERGGGDVISILEGLQSTILVLLFISLVVMYYPNHNKTL